MPYNPVTYTPRLPPKSLVDRFASPSAALIASSAFVPGATSYGCGVASCCFGAPVKSIATVPWSVATAAVGPPAPVVTLLPLDGAVAAEPIVATGDVSAVALD